MSRGSTCGDKRVAVLGAGIAGLSCASYLAKAGFQVKLFEKHPIAGGRARKWVTENGFVFDMGPSWYWMPEIFEHFFADFDYTSSDFYELHRLDPSYQLIWEDGTKDALPASFAELLHLFEQIETGAARKLVRFLLEAEKKYQIGMGEMVYKPSLNWMEFVSLKVLKGALSFNLLTSYATYVRRFFQHPKLLAILEFPILFLGATPEQTPALYSLMNYADLKLGTWYPMGGMYRLVEAFEAIALKLGVEIQYNTEIIGFNGSDKKVEEVITASGTHAFDYVVSAMDYHHTEQLLGRYANYSQAYWDSRVLAPSSLIYFVGFAERIPGLQHHNLFFDEAFETHAREIYVDPKWPEKPLFYVCCPSKTDSSVAPPGAENCFFLMPIAPDLEDSEELRESYFQLMLSRVEKHLQVKLQDRIVYRKSYCVNDFKEDYHAFKGNAYGLANTLKQTAIFKPKLRNRHWFNFYYTGQLTVPGPGLPPAVISGQVVATELIKQVTG